MIPIIRYINNQFTNEALINKNTILGKNNEYYIVIPYDDPYYWLKSKYKQFFIENSGRINFFIFDKSLIIKFIEKFKEDLFIYKIPHTYQIPLHITNINEIDKKIIDEFKSKVPNIIMPEWEGRKKIENFINEFKQVYPKK